MAGIVFFPNVAAAIAAGYEIERPAVPDSEGFLHARIQTERGWAQALVTVSAA